MAASHGEGHSATGASDHYRHVAQEFAADLRALRERAGGPSYRQLARQTHFSASTLAEAVSGRRLPTEAVLRALISAYGGDQHEWVQRLARANIEARLPPEPAARPVQPAGHASAPRIRPARGRVGRWATLAPRWFLELTAAIGIGLVTWLLVSLSTPQPPRTTTGTTQPADSTAEPTFPARDAQDPVVASCTGDAQLVDKAPLVRDGLQVGQVELRYSPRCRAGWARVYLNPGSPDMMATVEVSAADGTATSLSMDLVGSGPGAAIYTDVITPHGGCLLARATLEPASPRRVSAATACNPLAAPTRSPAER